MHIVCVGAEYLVVVFAIGGLLKVHLPFCKVFFCSLKNYLTCIFLIVGEFH